MSETKFTKGDVCPECKGAGGEYEAEYLAGYPHGEVQHWNACDTCDGEGYIPALKKARGEQ